MIGSVNANSKFSALNDLTATWTAYAAKVLHYALKHPAQVLTAGLLFEATSARSVKALSDSSATFLTVMGGAEDDAVYSIFQDGDAQYWVCGYTTSYGAGGNDILMLKLTSAGHLLSARTLGGEDSELTEQIIQSSDGGHLIFGSTQSYGAGSYDFLIAKFDASEALSWAITYGGAEYDYTYSAIESSDGSYVVTGYTTSFGAGNYDGLTVKINALGEVVWAKALGKSGNDVIRSIIETSDGGYLLAGDTRSYSALGQAFVAKLTSEGDLSWAKVYGVFSVSGNTNFRSIIEVSEGGYAFCGTATDFGAGGYDIMLIKITSTGELTWARSLGGWGDDRPNSIIESSNGDFFAVGGTYSYGAGSQDILLTKVDASGDLIWAKTLGGADEDKCYRVIESDDGGYVVTGRTKSVSTDNLDALIFKFDDNGSISADAIPTSLNLSDYTNNFTFSNQSLNVSNISPDVSDVTLSVKNVTRNITLSNISSFSVSWFSPTPAPTPAPTLVPTYPPSVSPTQAPYPLPTSAPTSAPTFHPSMLPTSEPAQNPTLPPTFLTVFGGALYDGGESIIELSSGGYALTGFTESYGAGSADVVISQLTSAGYLNWTKTLGGLDYDRGYRLIESNEGGYVLVGRTDSYGAGYRDILVVKLGASGDLDWAKTLGGSEEDLSYSVIETSEGDYVLSGRTSSFGAGARDALLVKFDAAGTLIWAKTLGGSNEEYGRSLVESSDGGYVLTGFTRSYGVGTTDLFIAKFASDGSFSWMKTLAGADSESIIASNDGGYVLGGYTDSFGEGNYDILIAKLSEVGELDWVRTLGGSNNEQGFSVVQSIGGNYVLLGYTESLGTSEDLLFAEFNTTGDIRWIKTLGGSGSDRGYSIIESSDGGYTATGYTYSYGAGSADILVVKLNSSAELAASQLPNGAVLIDRSNDLTLSNWLFNMTDISPDISDISSSIIEKNITQNIVLTDITRVLNVSWDLSMALSTFVPTADPTSNPTFEPTQDPTPPPTANPTSDPTLSPSWFSTLIPTWGPTPPPTENPTSDPTLSPSWFPTLIPTWGPMPSPTANPSSGPTLSPSWFPTPRPTVDSTTLNPTLEPTPNPTEAPTSYPTRQLTAGPTGAPTFISGASGGGGTTLWLLIGSVGGVVVLLGSMVFCYRRQRRQDSLKRQPSGALELINKARNSIERVLPPVLKAGTLTATERRNEDLFLPVDEIILGDFIAAGGFGEVFKGTYRGGKVAIKRLRRTRIEDPFAQEELLREAEMMKGFKSDYIVQLRGLIKEEDGCYGLVMEYMEGNLRDLLDNTSVELTWDDRLGLAWDIVRGLVFLHASRSLHRDLKSLNVLVNWNRREKKAKLTDFGLTQLNKGDSSNLMTEIPRDHQVGTMYWLAPELVQNPNVSHTQASDVYSLGMVLLELATRKVPFEGTKDIRMVTMWITSGAYQKLWEKIPADCPAELREAIESCGRQNPSERPRAAYLAGQFETLMEGGAHETIKVNAASHDGYTQSLGQESSRSIGRLSSNEQYMPHATNAASEVGSSNLHSNQAGMFFSTNSSRGLVSSTGSRQNVSAPGARI